MPAWFRWILVVPAALGSYFGIQLLVGIQSELQPLPDWLQNFLSQATNSVVGPWALVYCGARVAPARRAFETSVVLAVVYGIITGGITAVALLNPDRLQTPVLWFGLSAVIGIVTVIATCLHFRTRVASE